MPFCSFGQSQNFTTYKYGDSLLRRNITRSLFSFHDEQIVFSERNAVIITITSVSMTGKIDSVITINNNESVISQAIIDAIKRTKDDWLPGKSAYKIIIPIYITHTSEDTGEVKMNLMDFIPFGSHSYPITGIFLEPIYIKIGPRIAHSGLKKMNSIF